ncbi:RNA polymerase subunit sigma-70 [Jatrophihabitans sp. YIM 134969]
MTELLSETAFEDTVAPLRRELHAHCYRMLGSAHDADDAVQETLVKAWRASGRFEGRSSVRTWLYTVATRCCLDAARARGRRALPVDLGPAAPETLLADTPRTDVAWLEPYPTDPEEVYERGESVQLAFIAALQRLPGNQRAALLLFEVLGFPVAEIATMMQTSTASVNSALQRARATIGDRLPARADVTPDRGARDLATAFAAALERGDADALVDLLTDDVTWAMPPLPGWYDGRTAVAAFTRLVPLGSCGDWRAEPVDVNATPGFALWLRPPGGTTFEAWSVNAVEVRDDGVAAVTSFLDPTLFPRFGLPLTSA